MRTLLAIFITLTAFASVSAADLRIMRVWPDYRTTQSFIGISEYFTGREAPARNQTILRSQPGQRAGFYFLTRLANSGNQLDGAKIKLEVISPHSPLPVTYQFPLIIPHGRHVFLVGLTGADWPLSNEHPVAWRLTVLGADGQALTSRQSFLWSKPDGTR